MYALLILYIIGVVFWFVYTFFYMKESYEFAIFSSVFFPILFILGLVMILICYIVTFLMWTTKTIENAIRRLRK